MSTIAYPMRIACTELNIEIGAEVRELFNTCERELPFRERVDESERNFIISPNILHCSLADKSEKGRIAYCFMRACIRKVRWLSMKDRVPSGRGEFKPMEIPPATFEVGSSLRKLGEEVTGERNE